MSREKVGIIDTTPQKFDEEIPKMAGLKRSHLFPKNHFESSRHSILSTCFVEPFSQFSCHGISGRQISSPKSCVRMKGSLVCLIIVGVQLLTFLPMYILWMTETNSTEVTNMFTPSNTRELLFLDPLCAGLCIPISLLPLKPSIQVSGWHPARPDVMKKGSPKPTVSLIDFTKNVHRFLLMLVMFHQLSPPGSPTCPLKPWL